MENKKESYELLSVRIESSDKRRLEALALKQDLSISQIIRKCLKTYLKMEEMKESKKKG